MRGRGRCECGVGLLDWLDGGCFNSICGEGRCCALGGVVVCIACIAWHGVLCKVRLLRKELYIAGRERACVLLRGI